jgi:multiple sugar transport system permease protein
MASIPTSSDEKRQRFWLDSPRFVGGIFLLPTILYIVLLVGMPFVIAILFSLTDVIAGDTSLDWVGLKNFQAVWNMASFQRALRNSFVFTFATQILVIIFANIMAIVLTQNFPGKWFIRFLVILPWATPVALSTIGWLWFFDSAFSPIDWVLRQLNLLGAPGAPLGQSNNIVWLGKPKLAQMAVIFVQAWRLTPLAAVILMAALTSIPQDITDQAEVDGSRFFRTLFQIKLPLVLPIMLIALLFSTVFSFGDMAVVYVLTRGGPVDYTQILPTWSFQVGIVGKNLGQGAAIALFIFPVLLAASIVMLRTASRTEVN